MTEFKKACKCCVSPSGVEEPSTPLRVTQLYFYITFRHYSLVNLKFFLLSLTRKHDNETTSLFDAFANSQNLDKSVNNIDKID
ncbi:hypothetical protein J2X69_003902 [Algoriphagus sp. 4150]|nr:hypothetical protein [Algoriphagus sp. 4150]